MCEHLAHEQLNEKFDEPCTNCEILSRCSLSIDVIDKESYKAGVAITKLKNILNAALQILGERKEDESSSVKIVRRLISHLLICADDDVPAFRERTSTQCPGCGVDMITIKNLYCSDYCSQVAQFVRYARRRINDGKILDKSVLIDAFGSKFLMILRGGYPTRERRISESIRKMVFERDNGLCECGKLATEIDHRNGNSNKIEDLRAVCRACNIAAMNAKIKISPRTSAEITSNDILIFERGEEVAGRIAAPSPILACDDADWEECEPTILRDRKTKLASKKAL